MGGYRLVPDSDSCRKSCQRYNVDVRRDAHTLAKSAPKKTISNQLRSEPSLNKERHR